MKAKNWLISWLFFTFILLSVIVFSVYKVDPFFHYHKPDTDSYFYSLGNERSQNDGIVKHFDYNAVITGTSMTQNFKSSEMDKIFGVNSIKVPFSGASYKEINDNLKVALAHNPNLKTVVRCLDYVRLFNDKDLAREDLGEYPTYLYDKNPFNDVKYIFNKDIISKVYNIVQQSNDADFTPGITSFDDYANWQYRCTTGSNTVLPNGFSEITHDKVVHLTEEEKETIYGNITQNVTALADEYPDVDFYYFFSPYSAVFWAPKVNDGSIYKQIEAEQYAIELILEHPNIKLFSFNNRTDITTDLNHYKDTYHYAEWVNSLFLRWMKDDKYLLTKDNYLDYLKDELTFYSTFDYARLNNQVDYENDFYAAALLNEELTGAKPIDVLDSSIQGVQLYNATICSDQYLGSSGILCVGVSQESDKTVEATAAESDHIGAKILVDNLKNHKYIVFYGKKLCASAQPSVYVYNDKNEKIAEVTAEHEASNAEWQQYLIDLGDIDSEVTIVFNVGSTDGNRLDNTEYIYSGITIY